MAETLTPSIPSHQGQMSPKQFIGSSIEAAKCFADNQQVLHFQFGKAQFDLVCPGEKLRSILLPTLDHARCPGSEPSDDSATLYALSSECDGFDPPPSEWHLGGNDQELVSRALWRPPEGLALSSDESRGIWHLWDSNRRNGLYWVQKVDGLPFWEQGSPLRHHLHWLCIANAQHMLHGAVVGERDWGALLVGPGGSGKSTLTAASIKSGLSTTGDDLVALFQQDEGWNSYALYDVVKLTGMAEELFSAFAAEAINPERPKSEKALIPLSAVAPDQFQKEMPVNAVFSCRLTHQPKTSISQVSAFEVTHALLPATSKVLRTALREIFDGCRQVTASLPCYSLNIGTDPFEAVDVVRRFMNGGAAP